jgi:hypothetical protein
MVPLPAEIDDEYLSSCKEGHQPDGIPSQLAYFTQTLKLSAIVDKWKISSDMNNKEEPSRFSFQDLGKVMDCYAEIERYRDELPTYLRGQGTNLGVQRASCFELQSDTLRAR